MLTKGDNLKRIRIKVFLYTRLGGVSVYGDFATTQFVYTVRVYFLFTIEYATYIFLRSGL